MEKYQSITRTSLRGPEGTAFIDEQREQDGPVGFLFEAVEEDSEQLERVLGHLGERPSEVERYVYLIKLCERNERLFHAILMSDRIRFLLATEIRRRLLEIWSHLRSVVRHADFDQSQGTSRAAAA
jgi:hypothetical protein